MLSSFIVSLAAQGLTLPLSLADYDDLARRKYKKVRRVRYLLQLCDTP